MILVNTVPNPKSVAPKLQKLYNRKVPINVGRTTNEHRHRHQSGKTYSLVEIKFRRDKKKLSQLDLFSCRRGSIIFVYDIAVKQKHDNMQMRLLSRHPARVKQTARCKRGNVPSRARDHE